MRRTLGTAVFSGMVGVTLFGIFLTPVFFYVINRLTEPQGLQRPSLRALNGAAVLGAGALFLLALGAAWLVLGLSPFFERPLVRMGATFVLALALVAIPWLLGIALGQRVVLRPAAWFGRRRIRSPAAGNGEDRRDSGI
jgi:multidrug efflux pump